MEAMTANPKKLPPPEPMLVAHLFLDPHNPRLASLGLSVQDQTDILRVLWSEMAVNELVDSIAATGYWQHEQIFAAKEHGKLVVIEGNRRVAAVKLLTDNVLHQEVGATGIPALKKSDQEKLLKLPVVVCSRSQSWEYVGFRHVNGPQEWDSIAKAEYIARVHNEFNIPVETIAKTIGPSVPT